MLESNTRQRTGAAPGPAQFAALLDTLAATPLERRQSLVDQFWAAHGPTYPYVDGDQVAFLLRWAWARQVSLVGDITCWTRSMIPMQQVPYTDLWYLTHTLPRDARVDYKYVVDGNWIMDPTNPRRVMSGYGENSSLAMPDWKPAQSASYRPDVPHGEVIPHDGFYSSIMGNSRNISVYLPPNFDPVRGYPSFYVHDGLEYLSLANMATVLDNLIAAGKIEPLVAVFVPPVDRWGEYGGNKMRDFERFFSSELIPFIDAHYATATDDPARRGTMGASMGGHIALRLGVDQPQLFGKLAGQSSSLWAFDGQLMDKYRGRRPGYERIYLSTGNICDNTRINDTFGAMLRARGYVSSYHAYNEGHSWGLWQRDLEPLLTYLWPAK